MPSVAAWDAAGAMSAAAQAASKIVLIRIRAPGEELGSGGMVSGLPQPDGPVASPTEVRGPRRNVVRISRPPRCSAVAELRDAPAFLGGHELDGVLRRRLAGRGGAHLGRGAPLVHGDDDLADRQPRV